MCTFFSSKEFYLFSLFYMMKKKLLQTKKLQVRFGVSYIYKENTFYFDDSVCALLLKNSVNPALL
jgi:hypothetical protein